jgi:hypothetical protein
MTAVQQKSLPLATRTFAASRIVANNVESDITSKAAVSLMATRHWKLHTSWDSMSSIPTHFLSHRNARNTRESRKDRVQEIPESTGRGTKHRRDCSLPLQQHPRAAPNRGLREEEEEEEGFWQFDSQLPAPPELRLFRGTCANRCLLAEKRRERIGRKEREGAV